MVLQVMTLLHFILEEFVANEENVGQTLRFMDVPKGLPRLRWFFATLDVHKLIPRQEKRGLKIH